MVALAILLLLLYILLTALSSLGQIDYSRNHRLMAWRCRGCGCIPNAEKLAIIWEKIFNIWAKHAATFTYK